MAAALVKSATNALVKVVVHTAHAALDPSLKKGLELMCYVCKFFVLETLKNIRHGRLLIICPSLPRSTLFKEGHHIAFPALSHPGLPGARTATITVKDPSFWLRLATQGDLGFAEAYMYGEVDCTDLPALFQVLLDNRACLAEIDTVLAKATRVVERFFASHLVNSLANAQQNISAHYDISNEMFMAFLSGDMTYSCAIFPELDADLRDPTLSRADSGFSTPGLSTQVSSDDSLASGMKLTQESIRIASPGTRPTRSKDDDAELCDAQIRKMLHIMKRADIRPGHRVLEIGSGWGSMAICMAQAFPGVTVDTLTLSEEQARLARQRVADIALGPRACARCVDARLLKAEDVAGGVELLYDEGRARAPGCFCEAARVRVHLMDYRSMPKEWEGVFDRVVSVEMVEAVGREFMETYWAQIDWALKDTGVGVVQGITLPEARFEAYIRDTDFIRKWVLFPGGFLPTVSLLISTMTSGSKGKLVVESVDNIGPHYARTLREWRRRFEDRFDAEIIPALKKQYPDVLGDGLPRSQAEIEVFRRKWVYYFAYCEVGFASRSLGDHIVTFTREGNVEYGCHVLGTDMDV